MNIRIYETDFNGNQIKCTGEYFSGKNASEIVNSMKMNPFQSALTPLEYMHIILSRIGQLDFTLSDDENVAAHEFLQRLVQLGYAEFDDKSNAQIGLFKETMA